MSGFLCETRRDWIWMFRGCFQPACRHSFSHGAFSMSALLVIMLLCAMGASAEHLPQKAQSTHLILSHVDNHRRFASIPSPQMDGHNHPKISLAQADEALLQGASTSTTWYERSEVIIAFIAAGALIISCGCVCIPTIVVGGLVCLSCSRSMRSIAKMRDLECPPHRAPPNPPTPPPTGVTMAFTGPPLGQHTQSGSDIDAGGPHGHTDDAVESLMILESDASNESFETAHSFSDDSEE
ncbi:hypothetical protein J8273_2412 [Carpediemonas membranifera]|uniref:Transmembrane protein n=1 Tax=Carpediemonas membranifera TaxID=201153 RepID=A0A8J6B0X4_9EUKA|nr:hypothetical protein J8273_2412 [Carpediemonas membranifera]|eukprot:KAG9396060.1 hypothetical protein J8273_2412 [Carpediemonas membranifera]